MKDAAKGAAYLLLSCFIFIVTIPRAITLLQDVTVQAVLFSIVLVFGSMAAGVVLIVAPFRKLFGRQDGLADPNFED